MYKLIIRPLFFLLPAETAHHVGFGMLRLLCALPGVKSLARLWSGSAGHSRQQSSQPHPDDQGVQVMGIDFPNPIGLAAGFDKNAVGYEALGALGFGFVEIGTVTGLAQPGNPKPRLFRLPADRALINRMGFNNDGAARVAERLKKKRPTIVGVNIGKSKVVPAEHAESDYLKSTELLAPHADYLVVNVSSPNTPGLRKLQAAESLRPLLQTVQSAVARVVADRHVPLLVKIAPDLADEEVDAIATIVLDLGLAGVIATNTTTDRDGLTTSREFVQQCGGGGLSGAPLKQRALRVLRRLRSKLPDGVAIIAAGGIETAEDAMARLEAGADLVQIYTGFVYQGPGMVKQILKGLRRARWQPRRSVLSEKD